MARSSKLTAWLLMAVVIGASSLAAQVLPTNALPQDRPAGCHGHGSSTPAPQPTHYKCCLAAHNAAVLQALQSPQPVNQVVASASSRQTSITGAFSDGWKSRNASSGDPPGATPLRI